MSIIEEANDQLEQFSFFVKSATIWKKSLSTIQL